MADAGPAPWRSVRVRITAVSVIVFAVAFGAAAFATVTSVRQALVDQVAGEQRSTESRVDHLLSNGEPVTGVGAGAAGMFVCRLDAGPGGEPAGEALVTGGEASLPACPAPDPGRLTPPPGLGATTDDALVSTFEVNTPSGVQTVRLVSPLVVVQRSVDALTRVLLVGTPVLVLGVGAMVWWLVGRALRPVERLRAEVDAISHSTLDRRLRPPGSQDEIDRLAHTMNDMLDRLQRAAVEQQRFVSDASHELRSPLSVIRTALDVSRQHPDSLPSEDALARIDRAATRTEELVGELLQLARIDEPGDRAPLVEVDLDELVAGVAADFTDDAGDGRVQTEGTAGSIAGDPAQLRRMVGNLVGNAVAHAREQVVVRTGTEDGCAVLTVDDDGPGIPPEQRASVFERFSRLDGSRPRSTDGGGWGLGLAIAESVVRRHGGAISVGDAALGGARFVVRLPAAPGTRERG